MRLSPTILQLSLLIHGMLHLEARVLSIHGALANYKVPAMAYFKLHAIIRYNMVLINLGYVRCKPISQLRDATL